MDPTRDDVEPHPRLRARDSRNGAEIQASGHRHTRLKRQRDVVAFPPAFGLDSRGSRKFAAPGCDFASERGRPGATPSECETAFARRRF